MSAIKAATEISASDEQKRYLKDGIHRQLAIEIAHEVSVSARMKRCILRRLR